MSGPDPITTARQIATHCKRGHEYTPENTRMMGLSRVCKACSSESSRDRWSKRSGKGNPALAALKNQKREAAESYARTLSEGAASEWREAKRRIAEIEKGGGK